MAARTDTETQQFLEEATRHLNVAFDCTLVALALSLLVMFLLHLVQNHDWWNLAGLAFGVAVGGWLWHDAGSLAITAAVGLVVLIIIAVAIVLFNAEPLPYNFWLALICLSLVSGGGWWGGRK